MHSIAGLLRPIAVRSKLSHAFHRAKSCQMAALGREWPLEPRVGVGVVVFRPSRSVDGRPEVLLIKRGKEPNKGEWCFPGGSLELGESLAACAAREVMEETGIRIHVGDGVSGDVPMADLASPVAFTAVDSIVHGDDGRVRFHYAIVEVAALALEPTDSAMAADDVDDVKWVKAEDILHGKPAGLTQGCIAVVAEALRRFVSVR